MQFDTNRYSVPVKYAHRWITVVATVDDVKLVFDNWLIARHHRHWGRKEYLDDPIHYLALLERKPGAFDYARPLADWQLPEYLNVLRRRMERTPEGSGRKSSFGYSSCSRRQPSKSCRQRWSTPRAWESRRHDPGAPRAGGGGMSTTKSTVLVKHHLKSLKLPTMSLECH